MAGKWDGEGWFRDHERGRLHRVRGETHRGPAGYDGWSDIQLASYLRDFVAGDPQRLEALRAAKTRKHWLSLAIEWGIPYVSEREWRTRPDDDEAWHHQPPVSRKSTASQQLTRLILVARLRDVTASSDPVVGGLDDRTWDRHRTGQDGAPPTTPGPSVGETTEDWYRDHATGLMVRPCVTDPNVVMLVSSSAPDPGPPMHYYPFTEPEPEPSAGTEEGEENEGTAVLEVSVEKKIVEVRQIQRLIQDTWGIRHHRHALVLASGPHQGLELTSPEERLSAHPAGALSSFLVLEVKRIPEPEDPADRLVAMRILAYHLNSGADCERRNVHTLLWIHPVSEGSTHQMVVAAEADCAYGFMDGAPFKSTERVYALVDVRSGTILSSLVLPKPGAKPPIAGQHFFSTDATLMNRAEPLTFEEALPHLIT